MTNYALGLDGGGTKTRVQVVRRDGQVVGQGQAGPCNIAALPVDEALANAFAAAEAALSQAGAGPENVRSICAGVAGSSYADRRIAFGAGLQARFPNAQIAVEPDFMVALAGATNGGLGIVVIAGTGSAAYGENAQGEAHKTGAYGYLIDDAGSGYGVGRAAMAAVLREADGTGEPTVLTRRILEALQLPSLAEIVPGVYGGGLDRVTIASLSQIVAQSAREDDDAVARAILMRSGGALARLVEPIARRLFADADAFPIVPIGSLWEAGPTLTDVFFRSLARFAPQAVFMEPLHPPVYGAALRAVRAIGTA